MKVIRKFIILLVINSMMGQEMPLDLKIQQLPKELQKYIFSAQEVRPLSIYQAWRMLGMFDKLAINQAYDAQDKKFIEAIIVKVNSAARFYDINYSSSSLNEEIRSLYKGCPITGLLMCTKLSQNTKKIIKEIVIAKNYYYTESILLPTYYDPEEFIAAHINQLFHRIETFYPHYPYSLIIWAEYLFNIRDVLHQLKLLSSFYDIAKWRNFINKERRKYKLPPLVQKNTKTLRCIIQ